MLWLGLTILVEKLQFFVLQWSRVDYVNNILMYKVDWKLKGKAKRNVIGKVEFYDLQEICYEAIVI